MNAIDTRFWSKISIPEQAGGCWEWTAARNTHGYGKFYVDGRLEGAHRYAFRTMRTEIPSGLHLDHLCRNPACVNPLHLEVVTHAENQRRGTGFSGQYSRRTHCLRGGHPLSGDNLFVNSKGGRECRTCIRELGLIRNPRTGIRSIGERRPDAKLADADVPEIRRRAGEGERYRDLAHRYGVSPTAIGLAVRRVTWKHVA